MKLLHTIATLLALAASVVTTTTNAAVGSDADSTSTATPTPTAVTPAPATATPDPTTVTPPPTTAPPPVSLVRVTSPTATVTVTNLVTYTCYRLDACSTEAYRKILFPNLKADDNLLSLTLYQDAACKNYLTTVDRRNDRPIFPDNTTVNSGPFKSYIVYQSPMRSQPSYPSRHGVVGVRGTIAAGQPPKIERKRPLPLQNVD